MTKNFFHTQKFINISPSRDSKGSSVIEVRLIHPHPYRDFGYGGKEKILGRRRVSAVSLAEKAAEWRLFRLVLNILTFYYV